MKLKGVYKHPGWNSTYEFLQWAERTNPGKPLEGSKVSVSMKIGKRRKLKKMIVRFEWSYPPCSCCPPEREIVLEFPKKTA